MPGLIFVGCAERKRSASASGGLCLHAVGVESGVVLGDVDGQAEVLSK